ncbi:hypothetical protein LGN09_06285 [Burkholderia cenocepacia]|uniref:hypothetical protein n=1 Tax=Burkholderia cenocepacia TaxID=95486 RepID=UPI001CF2034C|nr:hypothetical protein [Burkholderia cenocepacia]MCA8404490.1 hypothetical protein [Burkholderia cenocepacia]
MTLIPLTNSCLISRRFAVGDRRSAEVGGITLGDDPDLLGRHLDRSEIVRRQRHDGRNRVSISARGVSAAAARRSRARAGGTAEL